MGELSEKNKVEESVRKLKISWKKFKKSKSKNALYLAILHAFKGK